MQVSKIVHNFNICFIELFYFRSGLKTNGVIILKENVTSGDDLELDEYDSSVTRPMNLYRKLFEKANLDCYRVVKQQHFPKGLFSVFMFVLKPRTNDQELSQPKDEHEKKNGSKIGHELNTEYCDS